MQRQSKEKSSGVHIDVSIPTFGATYKNSESSDTNKVPEERYNPAQVTTLKENLTKERRIRTRTKSLHKHSGELISQETDANEYLVPKKSSEIHDSVIYNNADIFRSISSVSTPSQISQITGINMDMVQEFKSAEVYVFPESEFLFKI